MSGREGVMFRGECLLCNFIDKMFCGTSNECVDEGVFGGEVFNVIYHRPNILWDE